MFNYEKQDIRNSIYFQVVNTDLAREMEWKYSYVANYFNLSKFTLFLNYSKYGVRCVILKPLGIVVTKEILAYI